MSDQPKLPIDKEMAFDEFFGHYVEPYLPQYWLFFPGRGYIVWRFGTGENVELLHMRAFKTGEGLGPRLVKAMLRELRNKRPYFSVFGFTLGSNTVAQSMYRKVGFDLAECPYPYKGGPSMIFSQSYDILCEKLLKDDDGDPDLVKDAIKSENLC